MTLPWLDALLLLLVALVVTVTVRRRRRVARSRIPAAAAPAAPTVVDPRPARTAPIVAPAGLDADGTARLTLVEVVRDHGPAALDDPELLAGLLSDLLPHAPREARLIRTAAEHGVAALLADRLATGLPAPVAVRDVSAVLAHQSLLDPAAGRWIVTAYAAALGQPLDHSLDHGDAAPRPLP